MAHSLLVERDEGGGAGFVSTDRTGGIVAMSEKSLREVALARLCNRQFFPSPAAWEDQVLYFLMLDRFSDDNEQGFRGNNKRRVRRGTTPQFQPTDAENAVRTPAKAEHWRKTGAHWMGSTLKGLTSKIGYLQRLGVT